MFYAHLLEDLVAMHVYECGFYKINGYAGLSRRAIRDLSHSERIDELAKIYRNQDPTETQTLISVLHLLRKIRNAMTHAFLPQVGSDFRKEEGVEQVIAMLKSIVTWERLYLDSLSQAHRAVLNYAVTDGFVKTMEREEPLLDARVARSEIQKHLDDLKAFLK